MLTVAPELAKALVDAGASLGSGIGWLGLFVGSGLFWGLAAIAFAVAHVGDSLRKR
jgi:hypothetical protein